MLGKAKQTARFAHSTWFTEIFQLGWIWLFELDDVRRQDCCSTLTKTDSIAKALAPTGQRDLVMIFEKATRLAVR